MSSYIPEHVKMIITTSSKAKRWNVQMEDRHLHWVQYILTEIPTNIPTDIQFLLSYLICLVFLSFLQDMVQLFILQDIGLSTTQGDFIINELTLVFFYKNVNILFCYFLKITFLLAYLKDIWTKGRIQSLH